MAVVELHMPEGLTDDDRVRMGEAVTRAVQLILPVSSVTVMSHDYAASGFMRDGVLRQSPPALPDPEALVRSYLDVLVRDDLDLVRSYLAEGFTLRLPGRTATTDLAHYQKAVTRGCRHVKRKVTAIDVVPAGAEVVVYATGTMEGVREDGTPFAGYAWVDRLLLKGGRILRHEIWDDLGA
ncbi:nuclear transport factor 2 family protein [Chachezhania sediminis]|uniref:nuclear transport factor 2 family protein n=1 Tax=Chachezhania sediminis TaxID=2599291 RepID=UPI00131D5484|nr:nuclear transport factor 2 family protein [Chachezhania sediminis]